MIRYPAFIAAVADGDVEQLATRSGVPGGTIRAIVAGGIAPSLAMRDRLARALGANPIDLFRLEPHLEAALAGAPSRYVTDPATLRNIDGRHAS